MDLLKQFKRQTQSSFDFQQLESPAENFHSPDQNEAQNLFHADDNQSLGSGGVLGNNWQALFGDGQAEIFPDLGLESVDDWLATSMNINS